MITAARRASRTLARLFQTVFPLAHAWAGLAHLVALCLVAAVVAMPTCAAERAVAHAETVRIERDYGGSIAAYMREVDALRQRHLRVEIVGECRSACTLYLGAENVCVSRSAALRFHGPSRPDAPLTPRQFDAFSVRMAQYYPEPIRSWFLETARYRLTGTYTLTGPTLIRMGVPECAGG